MSEMDEFLWVEKYRPKRIDDCVLPETVKKTFHGYVEQGRIPTLLLSGGAGTGKTTIAKALCNEIGADWMIINASAGSGVAGIDAVRTTIQQFASTVSFTESKKVTILDEADGITPHAQAALRNFIEEYSGNHSIIMTCNYKNKIIEPLHSRSQVIDFKIPSSEKPKLAGQFFKIATDILTKEGVEFDKKVVAELVSKHFPDFRRCLNELQRYSSGGKIDSGILVDFTEDSFSELVSNIKNKKFNDIRKWVAANADTDTDRVFRVFYDKASEKLQPAGVPELIMLINQYQMQSSQVADQEINTMAFFTELMLSNISWK
jgi:DNA polymerase III delta prime subunit